MKRTIAGALTFLLGAVSVAADPARYQVYTENLPPVSYADGSKVSGLATEIVEEMFARAGEDATFKLYPWARAYKSVLDDETGFIYTLGRNATREKSFQWIGPILIREVQLWALDTRADVVPTTEVSDLRKYDIGVLKDESAHQILVGQGLEDGVHTFPVAKMQQNLKKLVAGRIDLIPGNNYVIGEMLKGAGFSSVKLKKVFEIETGPYFLGANTKVPADTVSRLREALAEIRSEDFVEQAHARYGLDYNHALYREHGFGPN